jgi:kinesin motor protein
MNAHSSRSHCIVFLDVSRKREGVGIDSHLALVDLAGSECLGTSGAKGISYVLLLRVEGGGEGW